MIRRWDQIAAVARSTPNIWRQHPDLIAVNEDVYRHVRRRVRALQPTADGKFRYKFGHKGVDQLGREIYDLKIMWVPVESTKEER